MARIENRGNGSWRVTISGGYGPDGKQIRLTRTVHVNPASSLLSQRRQAEKEAAALETDFSRKQITAARQISLRDLSVEYLHDISSRRSLAESTVAGYQKLFDRRILPSLGSMTVQSITPRDVSRFLRKMSADGLSGTYSLKYFQQLNECLRYARRMGYITVNPCDPVERPKVDTPEARFYEPSECRQIISALSSCDPEWRLYFSLSIYTGMRPGEQTGLNWSDLSGSVITVQAGSVQLKGQKCKRTDRPKTKKSNRKIELPDSILPLFARWKAVQSAQRLRLGEWHDPDAIFTNDLGYRIGIGAPSKAWKRFTAEHGLRHLPLYDLRHTNASLMISQGLNVQDVSARLGHSQTSTTLNVYSHSFADAGARATQAVMDALEAAN